VDGGGGRHGAARGGGWGGGGCVCVRACVCITASFLHFVASQGLKHAGQSLC
jgi:hypothetical protein